MLNKVKMFFYTLPANLFLSFSLIEFNLFDGTFYNFYGDMGIWGYGFMEIWGGDMGLWGYGFNIVTRDAGMEIYDLLKKMLVMFV